MTVTFVEMEQQRDALLVEQDMRRQDFDELYEDMLHLKEKETCFENMIKHVKEVNLGKDAEIEQLKVKLKAAEW